LRSFCPKCDPRHELPGPDRRRGPGGQRQGGGLRLRRGIRVDGDSFDGRHPLAAPAYEFGRRHEFERAARHADTALQITPRCTIAAIALARVRLREQRFVPNEAMAQLLELDCAQRP